MAARSCTASLVARPRCPEFLGFLSGKPRHVLIRGFTEAFGER
jgi:hypothetical protein